MEKVLRGRQRLELQNGSKNAQLWFLSILRWLRGGACARAACGFSFWILLLSDQGRRCANDCRVSDGVAMILCVICGGGVWFVESACQKKGMDTGTRSWVCRECVEWVEECQKSRRHGMLLERGSVAWCGAM